MSRRRTCMLACIVVLLWAARLHLRAAYHLLLEPIIFTYGDKSFVLSVDRDNFDDTFSRPNPINASLVPAVIHNVLLGGQMRPGWKTAVEACHRYHPDYRFELWDDERAVEFVEQEYPELLGMWNGYKHNIQRVDSLRYLVLYKQGGIFLDLDLECRQSLDPLRQFDFVAAAAYPAGVSNGFMMVQPGSPFMKRVIDNLVQYDLNWMIPYPTVSFSTGCHYLSTIHAFTPNRTNVRVLGGPNKLNGHATTPLFHHGGSSSWHSYDAELFKNLRQHWTASEYMRILLQTMVLTFSGGMVVVMVMFVLLSCIRREKREPVKLSKV